MGMKSPRGVAGGCPAALATAGSGRRRLTPCHAATGTQGWPCCVPRGPAVLGISLKGCRWCLVPARLPNNPMVMEADLIGALPDQEPRVPPGAWQGGRVRWGGDNTNE